MRYGGLGIVDKIEFGPKGSKLLSNIYISLLASPPPFTSPPAIHIVPLFVVSKIILKEDNAKLSSS